MQTNLTNLRIVYSTALGEISNKRNKKWLERLWPVIFSIEQLGYLLLSAAKQSKRPILKEDVLAQFLLVFEMMAKAAKQQTPPITRNIPEISDFQQIQREIGKLQIALQTIK